MEKCGNDPNIEYFGLYCTTQSGAKPPNTKIDARLINESLWLTQQQMADLFQTTKQNISLHLINIYKEGELDEYSTVKDFLTVQKEGRRKKPLIASIILKSGISDRLKKYFIERYATTEGS